MFSSRSGSVSNSNRVPSAEGSLYNFRSQSVQKIRRPGTTANSNQDHTRAATSSLSHRSQNSQKFYYIENFGEAKGWTTDRSLISSAGGNSASGLSMTLAKITAPKKRPATSLHQRPKTSVSSHTVRLTKQKNDCDEVERSVNRDNTLNSLETVRASILKDIPRMRDISVTVSHSLLKLQEKLKMIDSMHKVDLSRTFRSKFEEELITEAEEIAAGGRKPNDMLTIKIMAEERFMVNQDGHVQFRVKTENAKFPLEVKIDFLPRDAQYFFEVYVSSTVTAPTLSRHDFRYLDKVFTVDYSGNPSYLYFTISAITALNLKWVIFPKDEKTTERHTEKPKPANFVEQYKKCLENLKERKGKDYEFMAYNQDEMVRFKEEVNQIKKERLVRYKTLARDGRNIMQNNIESAMNLTSGALIMKIRNRSEETAQKREDVKRKKEDLMKEQKTKKLILLHKNEIRHQAKQVHLETLEKKELKRQIQMYWIKTMAARTVFREVFEKIKQGRFERFSHFIENLRAAKIQRAYRKYRAAKGRNAFERKIRHVREGLNVATTMFYKVAHNRSQKILKQHLAEVCNALCIKNRVLNLFANIVKIQRAYKRYRLMAFFRRVCVMKIINDTCQEVATEPNAPKTTKKKDPRRVQFYQALRENREFQRFVIKYYLTGKHLQKVETEKNSPGSRGIKRKPSKKKKTVKPAKTGKEIQASPKDIKALKKKALLIEDIPSPKTSRSASVSSSSSSASQKDKKDTTKKLLVPKLKPQKTNEDNESDKRGPIRVPSRDIFNAFLEKYYKDMVIEALKIKYASYLVYFN